ncbi:iron-containing alcohol dehydrogenase [Paracoccus liaowanqingii]|uniref:Iron-containing alcohol dehydrogenase n=1 Tax=Paracoccus liaowanqingii TaxID=2560053 RepID=A0A4Z1BXQ7_9RHOB|nr:iron-containing alcohol dehydrogenase [Paracoccus liaowanqingii]
MLVANRRAVTDPARAARLDQVGRWIGAAFGQPEAPVDQAAGLLEAWSRAAGLPGLLAQGIDEAAQGAAAQAAASSSSMRANPAPLDADDLLALMRAAG